MWLYNQAFLRNLGLITLEEQEKLRWSRVAVAGLGGVGGSDLIALARLGISKFTIADFDKFEIKNTNRQYGATVSNEGRLKAEVMAQIVHDINPEAEIRIFTQPLSSANADDFLKDANILVDGIDAFEIDIRRILFRKARELGIYALGAGPVGFSTVWAIFSPSGMTYDHYFDFSDDMNLTEKFVAYVVGMAPKSTQRSYMDLKYLNVAEHTGPSAGLACNLASGVVAAEVLKIILNRGPVYPAPYYHQFDAYKVQLIRKRLFFGNKNPLQKLKRLWLVNFIKNQKEKI